MQTLFLSPPDTPRTNDPPITVSWHLGTSTLTFKIEQDQSDAAEFISIIIILDLNYDYKFALIDDGREMRIHYLSKPSS
jgi:hypothetical protein